MIPPGERRTAILLGLAQSLFQTAAMVMITVGGLVGLKLAPDPRLATLPLAVVVLASTLGMIPAALLMQRQGRRAGFLAGCVLGIGAGAVAALAILVESFWVFLGANALLGAYGAFAGYYRFAAADAATPAFRSQALSWVVAGGVLAALLGPTIVRHADKLGWTPFLAPFVAMIVLGVLALVLVATLHVPPMADTAPGADALPARPLREVMRQPVFFTALAGTTAGYAVMVMVMTATPLAMEMCGLPLTASASVIQWHMLGMFVPSFFTGKLIQRVGVLPVMGTGVALLAGHVAVALSGIAYVHFVTGLILLGVGWNFLFVGGSMLLTEAYRPAERARVQAAHDFIAYGVTSIASFSAGGLLAVLGWRAVNIAALPALMMVACLLFALAWRRRRMQRLAMQGG